MAKKSTRGRKKGGKSVTGAVKAGTIFAPARCTRLLRKGRYAARVGGTSGAFMAAVLEYVCGEVLELGGNTCHEKKKKLIMPSHINIGIQ
jgi:histone H2A